MPLEDELREAPAALLRQRCELAEPVAALVARLRRRMPAVVVTSARGSSAHAATFAKHQIERYLGIPVAEAAPVVASVYRRRLRLDGQLFLAISQSGRSDDLIACAAAARESGAVTAALVNDTDSPLAAACEIVLPLGAGPERSVAATKSFVASLGAVLRLVAEWADDSAMRRATERLPERLVQAGELDWSRAAVEPLAAAHSLVTLGRGPTLPIAREAALKLKEVALLHAEAFSGAEFRHGPIALITDGYPVLILPPNDSAAAAGLRRLASELTNMGARVLTTADAGGALPVLEPDHPETDAIRLIQSFYAMLPALARRLGVDPERPRHLRKVTRTE